MKRHHSSKHAPISQSLFPQQGHGQILSQCVIFEHPSSILVVGPTRSGKTQWVGNLLLCKDERFYPVPKHILYCYSHWQPSYDRLSVLMPEIEWQEGLPSLEQRNDSIVILDDLMDVSLKNESMMHAFTQKSHHQNITVILMMQNLFHQGSKARTMHLNAQYYVLFKNPRDRRQIKTLAMQMYPNNYLSFLQKYEQETNKPYGKLIVDLRQTTNEHERIKSDETIEQTARELTMNPNLEMAAKSHQQMNMALNNQNLSNSEKIQKYNNELSKANSFMEAFNSHHTPPPLLPLKKVDYAKEEEEEAGHVPKIKPLSSYWLSLSDDEETTARKLKEAKKIYRKGKVKSQYGRENIKLSSDDDDDDEDERVKKSFRKGAMKRDDYELRKKKRDKDWM